MKSLSGSRKKKEEPINEWRIAGVLVILSIIIGGSLWILGHSPLAEEEPIQGVPEVPLEGEENVSKINRTQEMDVDFDPPTEGEVSTASLEGMSIDEIAEAWKIRPDYYLYRFIDDYQLEGNYTVESKLWELQAEGGFTTQRARDLATEIESTKQENIDWVWPEPVAESEEEYV